MCRKITFCEKHNIERSIKKRSNRSDEYYCTQCKNEKARERKYLININNPDWVAKQNYKNNLTDEDKKARLKEYAINYRKTQKARDYNILNLKCKESNLYCVECDINRVYGKKICIKCKYHKRFILQNNFISTCLHCKNTFDIETKLLNKEIVDKINSFCSLQCLKDSIKHNYKTRYNNFKNNEEKLNRKRELDRIYSLKKRVENPDAIKQAQEKYKLSLKFQERKNYYKYKSNEGKCSNLYCIECNDVRLYGDKICDKCKVSKRYIAAYDYISICRHCNVEFGIDTKLKNLSNIPQLNNYCSIECNQQSKKITKKKNAKIHRRKHNDRHGRIRDDKQWARIYGNKYEPISRTIVYRKHNYICTSCGVKCLHPNKENYNQSNAATLDHIIPKSKGGSHTYDNVTLLCRSCNTIKSDKIVTQFKRNQSQLELQFIDYIPQGSQLQMEME
jgi:hypothetical protein